MKHLSLAPLFGSLLVCLLPCACASKNQGSETVGKREKMGPTLAERTGKWDMGKRSNFEKSLGTAGANKDFKTSNFHRQKDFNTGSAFSGGNDRFNAKSFGQSDKSTHDRNKIFSGADDKSKLGNSTYKTGESRFSREETRDSDKTSSLDDDVFRTHDNRMGTKGLENSKRPVVEQRAPDYTESQIRSLLNKG